MFKRFWLDVILGTVFIFVLMSMFSSITAFQIFDIFDPIGEALGDMEITDVVFSQLREDPTADQDIILVNIGVESRAGIAQLVDSISQHNPAVIGIDTFFDFPKEDTLGDLMLADAFGRVENLVLVTKALYNPLTDEFDSLRTSYPLFTWNSDSAHAQFITKATVQEDLKMTREFPPYIQMADGNKQYAFAVELARKTHPEKVEKFLARDNHIETINYRGNVLDYGATKFGTKFATLDVYDVLVGNYIPEMINDKIIIFCYLGKYLGDRETLEDKYFTPLNEKYAGRSYADMYGGVIHANIVSMILNEDYINTLSENTRIIIAIIITFLNVMVFSWIYKSIPRWYDGVTKLIQLSEILGLMFLTIWLLDQKALKMDLTIALAAVALVGDGLEVYYGVVKNSFTKEGRKELFKISKI